MVIKMKGGRRLPNTTFFNLSEGKKELIISSAMEEFSTANYNAASINQICKKSNIAKGSFYQYFKDKLDLYVFIMTIAIEEKIRFFSIAIERDQELAILEQIRILFIKGIEFSRAYPLYADLGNQFSKEIDEKVKSAVIKEGKKQSEHLFIKMIESAKIKGEIDNNIDSLSLSMILESLYNAVNKYMLNEFGDINYEHYEKDANKLVDSLLSIIFNGIKNR